MAPHPYPLATLCMASHIGLIPSVPSKVIFRSLPRRFENPRRV